MIAVLLSQPGRDQSLFEEFGSTVFLDINVRFLLCSMVQCMVASGFETVCIVSEQKSFQITGALVYKLTELSPKWM